MGNRSEDLQAEATQIHIERIELHTNDPDRFAFGLIDAFTKKITDEMAIPADFGPLTMPTGFQPIDGFAKPAKPVLIDGLTLEQCRERWLVNRSEQEIPSGVQRPVYVLTPAQIEAGKRYRTIQDTTREAFEASLLRVLVKTSDAERRAREPSVLVDLEDE